MPTVIQTLIWLDIPVNDLDRAINFYQQLFDCPLQDHRPNSPTATLKLTNSSNGLTLFHSKNERPSPSGMVPYINCHGRLEHAIAQVQINGGRVLQNILSMEPFGYRAVILDSEGNRIALHSNSTINDNQLKQ